MATAPQIVPRRESRMVASLLRWFGRNARDLPWRHTSDPYAIWISEVMLQQTQVKTVIPFWTRWMKTLPTISALAEAKQDRVLKLWEGLGYYSRARNLQKAAQQICEGHQGVFPQKFEDILSLPGIGRYTAGAIASIAFNEPKPILDGNVIRVLARLYGIEENPREKRTNALLWQTAERWVQQAKHSGSTRRQACSRLNQGLMELGALVCTPRDPLCGDCCLRKECSAFQQGKIDLIPALPKRVPITQRRFAAMILQKNGQYLVRQRPAGGLHANLWEFPNVEITGQTKLPEPFRDAPRLFVLKHSVTRYRISLEVYVGNGTTSDWQGQWFSHRALENLAFASAHRRIVERLDEVGATKEA